ncbi:MAG: hypothetical protein K1X67_09580 [Fimbriimonadaceae bacterium]|nr:hypothetical protein [Fimbriimonadaceae bacterium]
MSLPEWEEVAAPLAELLGDLDRDEGRWNDADPDNFVVVTNHGRLTLPSGAVCFELHVERPAAFLIVFYLEEGTPHFRVEDAMGDLDAARSYLEKVGAVGASFVGKGSPR